MLFVVAEAEPAEFELAVAASHVHAALVLLDVGFAFGAGLRVKFQPDCCVAFLVSPCSVCPCR
jgi:hypothetical protein